MLMHSYMQTLYTMLTMTTPIKKGSYMAKSLRLSLARHFFGLKWIWENDKIFTYLDSNMCWFIGRDVRVFANSKWQRPLSAHQISMGWWILCPHCSRGCMGVLELGHDWCYIQQTVNFLAYTNVASQLERMDVNFKLSRQWNTVLLSLETHHITHRQQSQMQQTNVPPSIGKCGSTNSLGFVNKTEDWKCHNNQRLNMFIMRGDPNQGAFGLFGSHRNDQQRIRILKTKFVLMPPMRHPAQVVPTDHKTTFWSSGTRSTCKIM